METIKRRNRATQGCRPKSVNRGFGCGLDCTLALPVPLKLQYAVGGTVGGDDNT